MKGDGTTGLVMHLANEIDLPLCGTHLARDAWHIQAQPTAHGDICQHCRRIHTKAFGDIEGSAEESAPAQAKPPRAPRVGLERADGALRPDAAVDRDRAARLPALLVVDDDPHILALLHFFLHNLVPTYDIITTRDAHSALRLMAERTVPIVITDYLMPGMNGLQLATAVKATSPMTHVILATTYSSAALEQRAQTQDVDTFLPKAALFERLGAVVRRILPAALAQV